MFGKTIEISGGGESHDRNFVEPIESINSSERVVIKIKSSLPYEHFVIVRKH